MESSEPEQQDKRNAGAVASKWTHKKHTCSIREGIAKENRRSGRKGEVYGVMLHRK